MRDASSALDRPDRLAWAKFTELAWTRDGEGFFYTRFPEPGSVPAGDEHYFARVCFHRLGTPQRLVHPHAIGAVTLHVVVVEPDDQRHVDPVAGVDALREATDRHDAHVEVGARERRPGDAAALG